MKLQFRQRLLSSTLLIGVAALATPAFAQDTSPATPPPPTPPTDAAPTNVQANPTGPVEGQPTPSRNAQGAPVTSGQDIIVTGTRIPQPNLTSAAPVTVVTNQDVKLTGTTRVEDLLNQLPSVGASQASGVSNGATGTAEVDLRYLGSKRTLSLVNGRRLTPGDPNSTSQAADLNLIPSALIKRVEVLTGGASSVYGADAVAGVVNFIMDTSFTGIRFDSQYSFYQHTNKDFALGTNCFAAQGSAGCTAAGQAQTMQSIINGRHFGFPRGSVADGGTFDGTVSMGAAFDDNRGHAVAYLGYRKVNPVLQSRRNYSECTIQQSIRNTAFVGAGLPNAGGQVFPFVYGSNNTRCGGSATANPGNILVFTTTPAFTPGGTSITGQTSTVAALGPGTLTPFASNLFNFAPYNYFQRPDERYIAGAFADYEVTPAIKPYLEFMFMDDRTLAQIAPSGDFANTNLLNCDNPLFSQQQFNLLCGQGSLNLVNGFLGSFPLAVGAGYNPNPGAAPINFINPVVGAANPTYQQAFAQLLRRNTEGGPRIADLKHVSYHAVVGVKGDLSKVWSYDSYFQYGKTDYTQVYKNEFSVARLKNALDIVTNPATGQPVCRSVLTGTDPNCVPYDIFTAAGPSAAAINYLNIFGVITGQTSEQIADVNFTGALGEMGVQTPWSDEGVGVNVGAEYRKESLELNPDQSFQSNDLAGQGSPTLPVSGNFRTLEAFGELAIPLIRHSFVEDLTVDLGYRKSWYKLSNARTYDTDTYKISAEFAPIRDIRFRGSYNRAVRAPNIAELFAPQFTGLDGSVDPCAGHQIQANEFGCRATGLVVGAATAANPAGQYNGLLGGNPNLQPEKATTKTVGVVLQPRMIPRLALTVDYWNIDLQGAIQGYGADAIINNCINHSTAAAAAPSCSLVRRDAGGSLWLTSGGFIIDTPNNVGRIKTTGWDFNASYSHGLGGIGNLSGSFIGTLLQKYQVNNGLPGGIYDCAGLYGPTCSGSTVASSAPMPRWRHKARLSLQMPNGLGFSAQWRYIGKVTAETLSTNETLHGAFPLDPGLHIPAFNYFDLAMTATVGDHYNFRMGVNNFLDKRPPMVQTGSGSLAGSNLCPTGPCNGNTYPGTWDALGRYIYAGVTLNF
jgi:iron complex outermembrane recepter protein